MAKLPAFEQTDPTLIAVDKAIERISQQEEPRAYLGGSAIGHDCLRNLWYSFRWAAKPQFNALTLKRFEDGHRGEDVQAARLRLVQGLELTTHKPDGGQYGFEDHGGHFQGHYDGVIRGLIQAPKTYHVWEHKQVDDSKQNKLAKLIDQDGEKNALALWDQRYYVQAIVYMKYAKLTRHYLTVATPGGRKTISCRTESHNKEAQIYIDRAEDVIFADEPPIKLSDDPGYYQCNWCDFKHVCHSGAAPLVNCRTCLHSTPLPEGGWSCRVHPTHPMSKRWMINSCRHHLYIPAMLGFATAVDADSSWQWVEYQRYDNGRGFKNAVAGAPDYNSREIYAAESTALIGDESVDMVKQELSGTLIHGA